MDEKISDKDRKNREIEEARYETIHILFIVSFVFFDASLIFDLLFNFINQELEEFLFLRFFVGLSGLYGTFVLIGGHFLTEYCGCDYTCSCGKCMDSIMSNYGFSFLFGGLLLIISYCIELSSIKF